MFMFKNYFKNWYLNVFDLIWYLQKLVKTLLNTKKRISFGGSFV
jgi:hypothetical protein